MTDDDARILNDLMQAAAKGPSEDLNQRFAEACDHMAQLRQDLDEDIAVRERLAELLTGVANALKGPPEPLSSHGWSDLPELARQTRERVTALEAHSRALLDWCAGWLIRARLAIYREGWEEGMSAGETSEALACVLFNLGCDDGTRRPHDIAEVKRLLAMKPAYKPPELSKPDPAAPSPREPDTTT